MFFRYNTEPAKLLRLFRQFRQQAQRIRRYRIGWGLLLLAGIPAYAFATWELVFLPAEKELSYGESSLLQFLVVAGCALLLIGWGVSGIFGRYPRRRFSPGGRGASILGLIVMGVVTSFWLSDLWEQDMSALLRTPDDPLRLWAIWAWTGFGMFLLSRWILWRRLKQIRIEQFELDFMDQVLRPLLRDLPPDSSCSLSCNPFPSAWTMDFDEHRRGAYIFHTYNDTLLEFKAKLPGDAVLGLRTLHRRVDKFKEGRKKIKDKGSKHRVVQSYRLEHPALKDGRNIADRLGQERLAALKRSLKSAHGGYEGVLRCDTSAGRMAAVQKKKFAAPRDLNAADLPSPGMVLGIVRDLWSIAAEKAGAGAGRLPRRPGVTARTAGGRPGSKGRVP